MDLFIYGILLVVSVVGLVHSMHLGDTYDITPSITKGGRFVRGYFLVSYLGCAGFGVLFFGTILTL